MKHTDGKKSSPRKASGPETGPETSLRKLKRISHSLEPTIWIGKSGLTGSIIDEIKKQLEDNGMVKVKMLRSSLEDKDRKELAREMAEKTGARVVLQVGHVVTLQKTED